MIKILFPTDFSKNANHAAQYASLMANQLNAEIIFLHIFSVPLISEYNLPHEIESFIGQNRIEATENLNQFVKKFIQETKIPQARTTQRIEYGFIPEKIVSISNELKADLIVMGTKGVADVFDRWIGTVAQKVVKKADCPVWIIPQKALIHLPKSILYAADFDGDELVATQKLVEMAKNFGAKAQLIHIHPNFELNVGHQVEAMASFLENQFENENLIVRTLVRDDIVNGLEKYIEIHKPDVLALASHEKSIFDKIFEPSISKHFVQEAKLPILCFRK